MKIILVIPTIIILVTSCVPKTKTTNENSNIGWLNYVWNSKLEPIESNTEIYVFDTTSETEGVDLEIRLVKSGREIFREIINTEMTEKPLIELKDINGDDIAEIIIEYLRPGRGSNFIGLILFHDFSEGKLVKLDNSIEYSNLEYNKDLGFISSTQFFGSSVEIGYFEIEKNKNSLIPKYRLIKEDKEINFQEVIDGKWTNKEKLFLNSDDIILPEVIELKPRLKIKNAS